MGMSGGNRYTKVEVRFSSYHPCHEVMFIHDQDINSLQRYRHLRWQDITDESWQRLLRVCNADKQGLEVSDDGWTYYRFKEA